MKAKITLQSNMKESKAMGEKLNYLKDSYEEAKKIAEDTSVPANEAFNKVLGKIHEEYATASNYAECRKKRKMDVANRLHNERENHNFKQQDVASKTGINAITLSGYEIGKNEPNMEALVRLADVYDVTLDYLMCRTDEEKKP